jgi:hypothetical protein
MGLTRKRARGIAGKHVAPRRKLAAAAVRDLLNTRSKHDLGPLQSGSATAPPRVLKLTTLDGPGGLIVRPPTPSREHVLRDPVVLYKMHRLDRPPRVEFETRWTSPPGQPIPAIVGTVPRAGLPDAERGTTGTVNRQRVLLTAANFPWQANCQAG